MLNKKVAFIIVMTMLSLSGCSFAEDSAKAVAQQSKLELERQSMETNITNKEEIEKQIENIVELNIDDINSEIVSQELINDMNEQLETGESHDSAVIQDMYWSNGVAFAQVNGIDGNLMYKFYVEDGKIDEVVTYKIEV